MYIYYNYNKIITKQRVRRDEKIHFVLCGFEVCMLFGARVNRPAHTGIYGIIELFYEQFAVPFSIRPLQIG